MQNKIQTFVAYLLLLSNLTPTFAGIVTPQVPNNQANQAWQDKQWMQSYPRVPMPQSLTLTSEQLGIAGPFSVAGNYSDLTGAFISGQYLKLLTDRAAFSLLGEYGEKQYRLSATGGGNLTANSLFKLTAEHFRQKLPFSFDSGNIEQWVGQSALGFRLQNNFHQLLLNNISVGGYFAKAQDIELASKTFISNGFNCAGFAAGLQCINDRNIAGATSLGVDAGMGSFISAKTYVEGKLYYDRVHYNTIFSADSIYNRNGFGAGVNGQQLISSNLKFSAGAELRKIYDTYNVSLSWLPPLAINSEVSLTAQRVVSHNQTPNNDLVGMQFTFQTDRTSYERREYSLNKNNTLSDVGVWVKRPAVKMMQVLAIAEQVTRLVKPLIASVIPNNGPLIGGNTVTISGSNFSSDVLVNFGNQLALVTSVSTNAIKVIVPGVSAPGAVDVVLTMPDKQVISLPNGYIYTNSHLFPIILSLTPNIGHVNGVFGAIITGNNFLPAGTGLLANDTLVHVDGITIIPTEVTPTTIVFDIPAHTMGNVNVDVTNKYGKTSIIGGFTYITEPSVGSLSPSAGPISGMTITLTGSGFIAGSTLVNFNGNVITPTSVTPTSLTFVAPPHALGTVNVSVTTPAGTSTNVSGGFTYIAAPTVGSLTPAIGHLSGVVGVTLTGTNFVPGSTTVTVDGIVVTPTLVTPTSLTFNAPPHGAGLASVTVTTPAGTSAGVPGGFIYDNAPSATSLVPAAAPLTGQIGVVITGGGFIPGNTVVNFDGLPIIPTAITPTAITFNAPAHAAGTVAVSVTTPIGTSPDISGGFTYVAAVPVVGVLTSVIISLTGQTGITLSGSGFIVGNTIVNVDGIAITPTAVTATTVTFDAPAHAAGTVVVNVTTSGGTSSDVVGGLTYAAAPTAGSITPHAAPLTGLNGVVISGSNFITGNTTVNFDGAPIAPTLVTPVAVTFDVPAHPAGTVDVSVSTPAGTSANISGGFVFADTPQVTGLTPTIVPLTGLTGITITGSGFVAGHTTVNVDGIPITPTLVTPTSITFDAPAHSGGTVVINVTTPGGTSADISGGLTYTAAPTVGILTPATVPLTGLSGITLTGTGFIDGHTVVNFDGLPITPTAVTPTSLTFDAPAHAAGVITITVTTPAGVSASVGGGLIYAAAPILNALTPAIVPLAGATGLTLTGTGFVIGDTTVNVDSVPVIPTLVTPTLLIFDVPAHAAGTVTISVSTSGDTSTDLADGLTYADAPTVSLLTPSAAPLTGLTGITLTGSNFIDGNTIINFDGLPITPTALTPTTLTFDAPAHAAGTVAVSVTTPAGTSANVSGGFVYTVLPTVGSLTPDIVPLNGLIGVTLSGTGFVPGNTVVNVDGAPITPTSVTPTLITFDVPAHADGLVTVNVTIPGGTSADVAGGLTFAAAPTLGVIAPRSGPLTGLVGITLTGNDFIPGNTVVNLDGVPIIPTSITTTTLTFDAPPHAAGAVTISVSTPVGTSANLSGGFVYAAAPTVNVLTPAIIPLTGQIGITLTGNNFIVGDTIVNVDGQAIIPTSVTPTSLTFDVPAHAAGTVTVNVSTAGGTSSDVVGGLTYTAAPTVGSLTPATIPLAGFTGITLTGTGFIAGNTLVNIDGVPVTPTLVTPTSITFDAPAHAAGTVTVNVTTPAGVSANVGGGLSYVDTPTVGLLSPTIIPLTGAVGITLTGTHFVPGNTVVTVDGVPITPTAVTATSLTFNAPAHAAGAVTVNVTTPGGTSADVAGDLIYAATPTVGVLNPQVAPLAGINGVTLSGTGFIAGNTVVNLNGLTIIPTAVTPTSLTFDAPAHAAGSVAVSVTTPAGTSANVNGGFTYAAVPTVGVLNPAIVPLTGLTGVTLSGTGFIPGYTTVNVDGAPITPSLVTSTSITFDVPAHAAGSVTINVTTPGGTSSDVVGGLTYSAPPTVATISPTAVPIAGLAGITLTGTDFIAANTLVNVGGMPITPTAVTPTSITFDAPAHAAGTVTISVTTPAGTSANLAAGLIYAGIPTAGSLTPAIGNIAGVAGVVLTGTGFIPGNTTVVVDGTPITPTAVTATSLTFDAPAHAAGNVSVSVTTAGGSANVAGGFTYINTPVVNVLTPAVTHISGAIGVTLSGSGFVVGNTTINFDGSPITPTIVTPTLLTFDAPAHAAGTVTVNVTTPAGTSADVSGGFTYVAVPTVNQLSPNYIPLTGATGLTLTGTGFVVGNTVVNVDGSPIVPSAITPTSVTFDVPAHAAGTVVVNVTTPGGTSADVASGLTYVAVPTVNVLTPSAAPLSGLTGITLSGTGFVSGNTTVNVGGVPITPTAVTPASLTFDAPAHAAGTVTVNVTTPGGTSANVAGGLTYAAAPTAGIITPHTAPLAGVVGVTITGTNFIANNTIINFDGSPITPTALTPTSLTFDAPAHAVGTVTVSVTTPAGTSANIGGGFTYVAAPTVDTLTPAILPLSGLVGVTLTGTDFVVGDTVVNVDGVPITPTSVTPTSLTFNAPAHAAGTVTVNVTTTGGTSGDVVDGLSYAAAPTVIALTPHAAPLTGLISTTLTGIGFIDGHTVVNFDGSPITPTAVTPTSLTFDVPPHAAGTVNVSVTTPAGTSANVSGGFTYAPVPTVNTLTPMIVPLAGLTGLTLTGSGFITGETTVNVDGAPITPTSITPTSLTFDVPAHAAGTVTISVTTAGGTSADLSGGLTYAEGPTVLQLTPNAAPLAGVVGVTLTGSGFIDGYTTVIFDGNPITPTSVTPTSLTFDAPAHAAGTVNVSVTTPAGSSANVGGGFIYAAVPTVGVLTPAIVHVNGLAGVTLTGTGFLVGNTIVNVDGVPVTPTAVSSTSITFNAPAHAAGQVTVNVTTPGGTSTDVSNGLTYAPTPTATLITPHAAPLAGYVGVIITGTGFISGNTIVNFDGSPITPTAVTSTSITFDAPAHAAGTVNVSVTTPAGSSSNIGGGFTYGLPPTANALTPTIVPLTGLTGVTLTGTNFVAGDTTVNVSGVPVTPTAVTETSLTFDAPAHTAGTVTVSVTTSGGTSANVVGGLTYAAAPTVGSLTPPAAPLAGFNGVTLSGTGFIVGNTVVNFNGSTITPTSVTPTSLTFDAPPHAAGTVAVGVTTPAGVSANVGGGFTYVAVPTVGSLSPAIVPLAGLTGITLSGTGFVAGNTTVNVDGNPITPTSVTSTSLTFDVPAHAAGTVTVNVTTPGGTSSNVSGGLTYAAAPTVGILTPSGAALTGVMGVTLSGTGFIAGNTTVNFDGSPITPTAVTPTSLTFNAPAHAAGTVTVSVSTPAGTSANVSGGFTYAAAPTVNVLTPALVPLSGLSNVVLTGTNFMVGNTTVTVDGSPITPTAVTSTSVTFNVPAHAAGTVTVSVTTPAGTSGNVSGGLTYVPAPTVAVLTPSASPLSGTAGVTLSGTGFIAGNTVVNFDGSPITPTAVTSTSLTFNAPAHAAGAVTVSVTTPGGTSANVSGNFTYVNAPTAGILTPTLVPLAGYTGVTLTGTNFVAANTTVSVDGVTVTPTAVTSTSLTFNAPAHAAGNVSVSVTTPAGSANVSGGLTYVAAPTVSVLTPSAAPLAGLNGITLSGTGFINGNTTVNFDGSPITPTSVTSTSLTFNAPAHAAGTVNVSVTTPGGTSANVSGGFTYAQAPTVGTLNPTLVPLSGYVGVTLTGTNFIVNNTTVNVDGSPITPTAVTSTSITFNVPAHAAGTVTVNVTTPAGTSGNVSGGLTYLAAPTVGVLTPSSGALTGVNGVTLSGNNFVVGNTIVNFDGSPITPTAITTTSLTFNAPAHAAGTVTVNVTTPVGTSANVSGGFTYSATPNISSCSYPGGILSTAWLCVGTNMNVFPNTYINVQGGLTCSLAATISLLTTTIKTVTNLGGNTILPGLYAGCTIRLCNNSTCTGLQSNVVAFS